MYNTMDEEAFQKLVSENLKNPNAPKAVYNYVLKLQQDKLISFYGTILKPEYYYKLKQFVTYSNESVNCPDDYVRGDQLLNYVMNKLI